MTVKELIRHLGILAENGRGDTPVCVTTQEMIPRILHPIHIRFISDGEHVNGNDPSIKRDIVLLEGK